MKSLFSISIVAVVLVAFHGESSGGPMRGPIIGRQVSMPGPIQGRPVAMRGAVQGRSVSMRQPARKCNNRPHDFNLASRNAYSRTSGKLYRNKNRNFNIYRRYWGTKGMWKGGRQNTYRRDKPGEYYYQ